MLDIDNLGFGLLGILEEAGYVSSKLIAVPSETQKSSLHTALNICVGNLKQIFLV